jgi:tRNA(Ile)-lysidine synthase
VLPRLEASVDPAIAPALARVAQTARRAIEALEHAASDELDRLVEAGDGALVLSRSALAALPEPLAVEVIRQAGSRLGPPLSLRAWGYRGLARLVARVPPRPFHLGHLRFEVSGDRLRIATHAAAALPERFLVVPGRLELPEIGRTLVATVGPRDDVPLRSGRDRAVFDADRLPPRLLVRARRVGDRVTPFGTSEPRRLKGLLIGAGVPRWDRGRVAVVESEGTIVWVAGLRRGATAPVGAGTRRILALTLIVG